MIVKQDDTSIRFSVAVYHQYLPTFGRMEFPSEAIHDAGIRNGSRARLLRAAGARHRYRITQLVLPVLLLTAVRHHFLK